MDYERKKSPQNFKILKLIKMKIYCNSDRTFLVNNCEFIKNKNKKEKKLKFVVNLKKKILNEIISKNIEN